MKQLANRLQRKSWEANSQGMERAVVVPARPAWLVSEESLKLPRRVAWGAARLPDRRVS